MSADYEEVRINVLAQGAVRVNSAGHDRTRRYASLLVDLKTKRATVANWGTHFWVGKPASGEVTGHATPYIALKGPKEEDLNLTEVEFPDYTNWDIVDASVGRYTLWVLLCRGLTEEELSTPSTEPATDLELLQQLEWRWDKLGTPCSVCHAGQKYGHDHDCRLALRLKGLGAEVKFRDLKEYPQ